MKDGKIISLSDIIENKVIKEKELEMYYKTLSEIQSKIKILEMDLDLTKRIISMIESESVLDLNPDRSLK